MLIAEELDLPLDKVRMRLADARPELLFNQFTGGSNSMRSIYSRFAPPRRGARQRLLQRGGGAMGCRPRRR